MMSLRLKQLILLLFAAGFCFSYRPGTDGAMITFETEVVDFGEVIQGTDQIRTIRFTNTGNQPLIIESIKGQCGCTSIPDSWPKEPIAPGQSSGFQVRYDTKVRLGVFDKKVIITSNAVTPISEIRIRGKVIPAR